MINVEIRQNLPEDEYKNREIIEEKSLPRKCKKCGTSIKQFIKNEKGKRIDCRKRIYCLNCSPFGERKMCGRKSKWYEKGSIERQEKGKRISLKIDKICDNCGKIYNQASRNNTCSTCRNLKLRKKNKSAALTYKGGKCQKCGYDKCSDALEFHHLDPTYKELALANSWSKSIELLKDELDKCILLCSNCHRELHFETRNQ